MKNFVNIAIVSCIIFCFDIQASDANKKKFRMPKIFLLSKQAMPHANVYVNEETVAANNIENSCSHSAFLVNEAQPVVNQYSGCILADVQPVDQVCRDLEKSVTSWKSKYVSADSARNTLREQIDQLRVEYSTILGDCNSKQHLIRQLTTEINQLKAARDTALTNVRKHELSITKLTAEKNALQTQLHNVLQQANPKLIKDETPILRLQKERDCALVTSRVESSTFKNSKKIEQDYMLIGLGIAVATSFTVGYIFAKRN